MAFIGGGNRSKRLRGAPLAALDVGTSKICCLISRVDADNRIRLRGVGQHISRGLRAGTVVDIEAAQLAIAQAVASAEEMAGETIRQVYVNVSGGRPASEIADVDLRLDGRAFGDADWRAILRKARDEQIGSGRALVHAIATNFSIDGAIGIQDPRGMVGEQASAKVHMVTAQASALRNLRACLAGCHIEIAGIAVSPYAAGLACLHDDEMNLGVTVVDMGAGTTSIASFFDGKLVFASTVPFGGSHVTSDIAHGVGASLEGAERVKALHGCAQGSPSDVLEIIDVPQQLDDDGERRIGKVPKSVLVGMMRPRLEEILEAVDERLKASGLNKTAGRRIVLTGGASQLIGTRELAQEVLKRPNVRLGHCIGNLVTGLPGRADGPAYATAAGLLIHAVRSSADPLDLEEPNAPEGFFGRVGAWLNKYL